MRRRRIGVPAVTIDAAVGDHLEVLGLALRWRFRVGLVERIGHADALDWLLLDSVHRLGRVDAGRLENRRNDIDDMVELSSDPAGIADMARPADCEALPRAAEVRS